MTFNQNRTNWWFNLSAIGCLVSLIVFIFFLFQSSTPNTVAANTGYFEDQVVIEVNKQRVANGLKPLRVNTQLTQAARSKTQDMSTKSYFSHVSPIDGKKWSEFIKESGYDYDEAGENLANGFDNVPAMVKAWMNSPSHRENILSSSVFETGVGISYGTLDGYPTVFVAQVFGRKSSDNETFRKTKVDLNEVNPTNKDSLGSFFR